MKKITLLSVIAFLLMTAMSFAQGVTTSSINGRVLDNNGGPLPGANIVVTHVPTGSVYGAVTDFDGFYRISNMRSGGPYNLTISYVGFEDFKKEGFVLSLGETSNISTSMQESANALDEIVITAISNGVFDANKTGSETTINQKKIEALPNVSRSIADFARLTPEAQLRGDNQLSIGGQNNRYNALYVDGAVNNDAFGLSGSGTNGGQTGVNPISIDAIESFQVNVAPYDVTIGGFAGGAISAVTKSGTNKFNGSAYYLLRNESLAGKTPGDLEDDEREKLAEFSAKTFGVTAGGPIIKDKLFFFINYEGQNDETPQPFIPGDYIGESGIEGVNQFSQFLLDQYGYNAGTFDNNTRTLESNKFLLKLDWNINENHKLSFRNNLVQADFFGIGRSSARTINFTGSAQNFESNTNTASLELNSTFGNKYSNRFIVGYTRVRDDRGINGDPFPFIEINDGDARIFAGSERFSTANLLEQDIFTLTNNFQIFSGRHTVTLGTHNEYSSVKNVFFGRNFGEYTYNSLEDFFNDEANEFRSSYSLLGGTGDESIGAAEFDLFQLGFYAQDEVQISNNFRLTGGLRVDLPVWDDGRGNEDFNNRTVGILEAAGKDLQGARVGQGPNTRAHISPRLGFNWDVKGDKTTQIRGGIGMFTSRIPLVWPGGAYNNTGTVVANTRVFRPSPDSGNTNLVPNFNPDVNSQFRQEGEFQGNIDLLADDLMLPQVFKKSFAIDQKLGKGFIFSGEISHSSVITGLNIENLNIQERFTTTGAGPRPNFGNIGSRSPELIDDTYEGIFLISNTNDGEAYNVSGTITKNFYSSKVDVRSSATYSYGRSTTVFEGTSSQNISNWAFNESVNGSNNLGTSISDFSQGHRTLANVVVDIKWTDNVKTTIGLFYQGAEGTPYSYVVGGGRSNRLINDTGEGFTPLPFIPSNFQEAQLIDDGDVTAEEQWIALNAFIEGDDYLRTRRGQFAERNRSRADWSHVVDLKFAQEFSLKIGEQKHTFQVSADMFNFTNFINKDWGRRFFTSGFDTATLVNFEGFADDGTTPQYTFNDRVEGGLNQIDDAGLNSSRWQAQIGLRYIFN
ncbi:carboxypeptidase regulatory-like domain-containing protein [uncultured Dokdonia sp.]|uniref:TonB-dependent receptor n=1 Tax=uncultured Dokdonia sp. TaxID=575653 RepID=UPI00260C5136|nr:carboxypeptidase regulatory-like domain-containing protein [uncultured Dokdonia sp.]